ncbi:MAG TPA: hypothetical protein VEV62_03795 [Parafilimonas sp.]|nr:hypothetical protein [Parafilimonas sp.]
MKILNFVFIVAGFTMYCSANAQPKNPEQDAVRKVIEQETRYFFDGNYDKWAGTWAQEPTNYVIFSGPNSNSETMGWDNISAAYKPNMTNVVSVSADDFAANYTKSDYQYHINGNVANVSFKEGKGNFETRTLEKVNGEWKLTSLTVVQSTDYKLQASYNIIKSFIGKWKVDLSSFRTEPAQTQNSYKAVSNDYDIHETMYGIEFASANSYIYEGKQLTSYATEDFITDYSQNAIKYFDYEKSQNGTISTAIGSASFDSSGRFVVKGMYPDKPSSIYFENIYTINGDGSIHHEGRLFDKDGKLTSKWFFDLHRI